MSAVHTEDFITALTDLAKVANGDTGQSGKVRRFLLGLYNGGQWPFDMTDLRCIDAELLDACLVVLAEDARGPAREVHCYLENGDALFKRWWQWERPARDEAIQRRAELLS